jgi:hypothetical protein
MTGTPARTPRQNSLLAFPPAIVISGKRGKLGVEGPLVTSIVLMEE